MPPISPASSYAPLAFNTPGGGARASGALDPAGDYTIFGNWTFAGSIGLLPGAFFQESSSDGITAKAGGVQSNATLLASELNRLATVATAGDSVMLPPSQAGLTVFVCNHGAQAAQVYGFGTDTIDDIATATGVSQMANSMVFYVCFTAGKWYTEGLATGYATSLGLQTLSYVDSLTAHAGGGQASATAITKMISRVSTVATAGDSVVLPASAPGLSLQIYNGAANSMNVFPATGEQINALGANAAFAHASVTLVVYTCFTAGQWFTK